MILRSSAVIAMLFAGTMEAHAFDCAKAATAAETAICGNPDLKALDDALGKAYGELRLISAPAERKMLARSQKRWITSREGCAQAEEGLATCIRDRTAKRLRLFAGVPESGPGTGSRPVPVFVVQDGDAKQYDLDVQLLRFETPQSPGEKTLNRLSAEARAELVIGPHGEDNDGAAYSLVQEMTITYASPELMSVNSSYWRYMGGAHGNGGSSNSNIATQSGKLLKTGDFFEADAAAELAADCKMQLIAEKRKRLEGEAYDPDTDDFLKDEVIAAHAGDLSRWSFAQSKASVSFDPYAIGSFAEGPYDCSFPMAELRRLARGGAPLPRD